MLSGYVVIGEKDGTSYMLMLSTLEEGGLVWVPPIEIEGIRVGENSSERDLFAKLSLSYVKSKLLDEFIWAVKGETMQSLSISNILLLEFLQNLGTEEWLDKEGLWVLTWFLLPVGNSWGWEGDFWLVLTLSAKCLLNLPLVGNLTVTNLLHPHNFCQEHLEDFLLLVLHSEQSSQQLKHPIMVKFYGDSEMSGLNGYTVQRSVAAS